MTRWRETLLKGVLVVVLTLWTSALGLGSECPPADRVVHSFLDCLQNATLKGVKVGEDVREVERKCRDGGYNASVWCVENLFYVCSRHEEQTHLLYTYARVPNIRLSFQALCDHFQLYSDNSECLARQDPQIRACGDEVNESLETGLQHHLDQGHTMLHTWRTYCRTQWALRDCAAIPVAIACGRDIARLISVVMTGVIPPLCHHMKHGDFVGFGAGARAFPGQPDALFLLLLLLLASLCTCCVFRW